MYKEVLCKIYLIITLYSEKFSVKINNNQNNII